MYLNFMLSYFGMEKVNYLANLLIFKQHNASNLDHGLVKDVAGLLSELLIFKCTVTILHLQAYYPHKLSS